LKEAIKFAKQREKFFSFVRKERQKIKQQTFIYCCF